MLGSQFCCSCRLFQGRPWQAWIALEPLRSLDEFERVGRRYQNLSQQRVRIERDWRDQTFQLVR